jgi:HSP20 family protein
MAVVEKIKKIGTEVGEVVEKGIEKSTEVFDNIVSHLPFANLAKKDSGNFYIEIEMPGIKREDIKIDISDNILTVSGTREVKNEIKREDYYLCESAFGRIERKFTIPDGIDRDKISAKLENGELLIELEKDERLKSKSIEIK